MVHLFEDSWLYFHRSWTGACIFGLRLDGSPAGGTLVTKCWASRDRRHYTSANDQDDMDLIKTLIASLLPGHEQS